MKNLTSPNIVQLHTWFLDGNALWVVMDWVDGGDLRGTLFTAVLLPLLLLLAAAAVVCCCGCWRLTLLLAHLSLFLARLLMSMLLLFACC